MAVRLSALCTRHTLLLRNMIIFMFLVLISVKRLSKPQGLVWPEGLVNLKITSLGIEPATFRSCKSL
jgi:hypothetical protein